MMHVSISYEIITYLLFQLSTWIHNNDVTDFSVMVYHVDVKSLIDLLVIS